jgi:hypothetical protein
VHIFRVTFYYDGLGTDKEQTVYLVRAKSAGDAGLVCGKHFREWNPSKDSDEMTINKIVDLALLDKPIRIYDHGPFGLDAPAGFS